MAFDLLEPESQSGKGYDVLEPDSSTPQVATAKSKGYDVIEPDGSMGARIAKLAPDFNRNIQLQKQALSVKEMGGDIEPTTDLLRATAVPAAILAKKGYDTIAQSAPVRGIGIGLDTAGKLIGTDAKALADLVTGNPDLAKKEFGATLDELQGTYPGQEPEESPWEQGRQSLPLIPRAAAGATEGLIESSPRLALAAVQPEIGAASFGFTPQGFDAVTAGTMLLAPEGGKLLGNIADKLAIKAGITSDAARQLISKVGGTSGVAGLMSAPSVYQISQMPAGAERDKAIEDTAANALLIGAMGLTGKSELKPLSTTGKENAVQPGQPVMTTDESSAPRSREAGGTVAPVAPAAPPIAEKIDNLTAALKDLKDSLTFNPAKRPAVAPAPEIPVAPSEPMPVKAPDEIPPSQPEGTSTVQVPPVASLPVAPHGGALEDLTPEQQAKSNAVRAAMQGEVDKVKARQAEIDAANKMAARTETVTPAAPLASKIENPITDEDIAQNAVLEKKPLDAKFVEDNGYEKQLSENGYIKSGNQYVFKSPNQESNFPKNYVRSRSMDSVKEELHNELQSQKAAGNLVWNEDLKQWEGKNKAGKDWVQNANRRLLFEAASPTKAMVEHAESKTKSTPPMNLTEKPGGAMEHPAVESEVAKYRVGNNPTPHTLVERLPQTEEEKSNGEQAVRVKNDRTGKVETVLESQLKPITERTPEQRKATKKVTAAQLNDSLLKAGLDPSSFPDAKSKKNALERADAKLADLQKKIRSRLHTGVTGLEPVILDGAISIARGVLKATNHIGRAVTAAIEWIRKNHPSVKFDADEFRGVVTEHLTKENTDKPVSGENPRRSDMVDEGETLIREALLKHQPLDTKAWAEKMLSMFPDSHQELEGVYREARAQAEIPIKERNTRTPFQPRQKQISVGEMDALHEVIKARARGAKEAMRAVQPELDANEKQIDKLTIQAQTLNTKIRDMQHSLEEMRQNERWMAADTERVRQQLVGAANEMPAELRGRFVNMITSALSPRSPTLQGRQVMYRRAMMVAAKMQNFAAQAWKRTLQENIIRVVRRASDAPGVSVAAKNQIQAAIGDLNLKNTSDAKLEQLKTAHALLGQIPPLREGEVGVQIPQRTISQLAVLGKVRLKDLDTDTLSALFGKVVSLERAGRVAEKERRAVMQQRENDILSDLAISRSSPMNTRTGKASTRLAGDVETANHRLSESAAGAMQSAANLYHALLPMDAQFNAMDGGYAASSYAGFLSRVFKGTVNWNRQRETLLLNDWKNQLDTIYKDNNLTPRNLERVNVYGLLKQEGGRERLVAHGESAANLDAIANSMSDGEMAFYRRAMAIKDSSIPAVRDILQRVFNQDLKLVNNHWPMMRDWSKHEGTALEEAARAEMGAKDDSTLEGLTTAHEIAQDFGAKFPTTKTAQGFKIERQKGAMTAIRTDPNLIYQHLTALAHFIAHQEDLHILGKVARNDLFKEKYGDVGQKIVLDFLDTVAKNGRLEGWQRARWLDAYRKSLAQGIIPWNPVVWAVHTTQIPVSMAHIGSNWFRRGAMSLLTEEGRNFVRQNMPTLLNQYRHVNLMPEDLAKGGNPFLNMIWDVTMGQSQLPEKMNDAMRRKFISGTDKLNKAGTWPLRLINTIHSMTTALGAYQRELAMKGLDASRYHELPVDKDALNRAMNLSRRTVPSVLPEDMPQILSRGKAFANQSGNVSVARTILQFGNTYLDMASNWTHDFMGGSVRTFRARDVRATPFLGALGFALAAGVMYEAGLRYYATEEKNKLTGYMPKNPTTYQQELAHEMQKRFAFGGSLSSAAVWKETGIPAIDFPTDLAHSIYQLESDRGDFGLLKTPAAIDKNKKMQEAKIATDLGTMAGIPAAQQVGNIFQKQIRQEKIKK